MSGRVAIVGRPNVGKSTLFNRLARREKAIVFPEPGTTRDYLEAQVEWAGHQFSVLDTGGLGGEEETREAVLLALKGSHLVVFLVDVREGLHPLDREVADLLRRSGKPLVFAANKADSPARESGIYDFAPLGLGLPLPVSATQGKGIPELLDAVVEGLRRLGLPPDGRAEGKPLRLAFLGRPNVGKSSLVNALLGRERLLVSDRPGTTRDAVDVLWRQGEREFLLVDTPGMRRRTRVRKPLEQASLSRARLAVRRAEVVCLVLEAPEPVTHHEKSMAGFVAEAGRSCVLLINKWDLVPAERRAEARKLKEAELRREFPFLDWAPVEFVSALTGEGLGRLPDLFFSLGEERRRRVEDGELRRVLEEAWRDRPPPAVGREFQKLFRASQAGTAPPTFVLEVSHPRSLPEDYLRYLEGRIRAAFGFRGAPIRFLVRGSVRRAGRAR